MQWAEINWPRSGAGHRSGLPLSLSPNLYLFEIEIGIVVVFAIPVVIRVKMKRCYRLLCDRCQEASSLGIDLGVEPDHPNERLFRFEARLVRRGAQILTNEPPRRVKMGKVSEFSEMVKNFVFQGLKIGAR
ncbi:hypothetical protein LAV78_15215 [Brucella intermedia]|uniref:hypothetical protein n=1 Tax=Brucella intermedia TaxID=94625 RepID=UPI001E2ECAB0|nr:hypothetical protein [Brucella intermedia]MCB4919869.1 hypothetical protein [Brucella intermedia]